MKMPDIFFAPGEDCDGFRVRNVTPVDAIFAVAYEIDHPGCGARILHVHTNDTENAFSINFPTPPPDDTGMPHILEHSVLAGSRKFPVKEPFFEMIKMSLATFINAMTGYDCTYYPVCSNVPRDLFNLADVYFDAVFHPLLSATTFQREAHHLAPADPRKPEGALRIDGIVYSEMKGAFSDPLARLQRLAVRSLLPDTCYGRESGGDPDAIPDLTQARLEAFHATHYHPSNAFFVFYGNIPTTDFLDFLRPRLSGYRPVNLPAFLKRQPQWAAPRTCREQYPIGDSESIAEKSYLALNWRVGDAADPKTVALWHILALALLGNEAAPLRRAIIDAHLGGDLVLSGASSAGCEATFHVGLQGAEPERLEAFRNVVQATLAQLSGAPLDAQVVAAAFQQAAYHYQEIVPMYPLYVAMRVVDAWIYDRDPLSFLQMRHHLASLRQTYIANPMLFSDTIRSALLDNPHRLDIVLEPDCEWQTREDARLARRLRQIEAKLNAAQRRRIAENAAELERLNGRPNPPEALARLPQLTVADLPADPLAIPTRLEALGASRPLLVNDVFSNGVVYLELGFDLTGLSADAWTYLPRYVEALNKMGAAGLDYAGMARRVSAYTGGIGAAIAFDTHLDDSTRLLPTLTITLKALDVQLDAGLAVLHDLLFALDPCDRVRARDVALQTRTHYRNALVQQGQVTVRHHAARGLTAAGHLESCVFGLPQLALSENWVAQFDQAFAGMADRIASIRDFILNPRRVTVSVTGSTDSVRKVRNVLETWLEAMKDREVVPVDTGFRTWDKPLREALAAPIQVAHCAMVMPAPHLASPDEPMLAIGTHMVLLDYLMNEIRFKGNAYGAGFSHHSLQSMLSISSFRDPHVNRTLDVFRGVTTYLEGVRWHQSDIDRAIIGVAKQDSRPIRPGQATTKALRRFRLGLTDAWRAERRKRLLRATPDAVRQALLNAIESNMAKAAVCVMAGHERLASAAHEDPGLSLSVTDILSDRPVAGKRR